MIMNSLIEHNLFRKKVEQKSAGLPTCMSTLQEVERRSCADPTYAMVEEIEKRFE